MMRLLKTLSYYIKRLVQKKCHIDFTISFGKKRRLYVSSPPGGAFDFTQKGYPGDLREIIGSLNSGGTYFDVGANFGHYALAVDERFQGNIDIHCFEPEEDAYRRLIQNKFINNLSWKCLNLAVSDSLDWLQISTGLGGYNHVVRDGSGQNVKTTTLDEYGDLVKIKKIDVLKIDVEGFEYFVLNGAKKLLDEKKIQVIIFEVDGHEKRYQVDPENAYKNLLAPRGYELSKKNENFEVWSLVD